jgi:hypothetical protein
MSAFGGKADIKLMPADVRLVPLGDIVHYSRARD